MAEKVKNKKILNQDPVLGFDIEVVDGARFVGVSEAKAKRKQSKANKAGQYITNDFVVVGVESVAPVNELEEVKGPVEIEEVKGPVEIEEVKGPAGNEVASLEKNSNDNCDKCLSPREEIVFMCRDILNKSVVYEIGNTCLVFEQGKIKMPNAIYSIAKEQDNYVLLLDPEGDMRTPFFSDGGNDGHAFDGLDDLYDTCHEKYVRETAYERKLKRAFSFLEKHL